MLHILCEIYIVKAKDDSEKYSKNKANSVCFSD